MYVIRKADLNDNPKEFWTEAGWRDGGRVLAFPTWVSACLYANTHIGPDTLLQPREEQSYIDV